MRTRVPRRVPGAVVLSLLLCGLGACGKRVASDPNNRNIPWTYGPTTGGATAEHVRGSGKEGGAALAKGWQIRLLDQKRLVVNPYELASSHPLFDKVAMNVGLFDKTGKQLGMVRSGTITAAQASFTFELESAVATQLWDVVIWYVKA